ncbi:MAG: Lrp/AsnC ligand binding domain-containing protein [Actinomycetota bacterium]
MSVRAFVLIQTEVGQAATVASQIGALDGIVTADAVTGPYDVIAQAEADTIDDLGRMVVSRIQMIYSYRQQVRDRQYLLYGLGGLFVMGLAIRAMVLS